MENAIFWTDLERRQNHYCLTNKKLFNEATKEHK